MTVPAATKADGNALNHSTMMVVTAVTALFRDCTFGVLVGLSALGCVKPAPPQRFAASAPAPSRILDPAVLATRVPSVESLFDDALRRGQWPGVSIAVVSRAGTTWTHSSGVADLDTKAPVGTRTIFRVGSITKTLTALTVLELRDEGKLDLDVPAERFLPELAGVVYPTLDSPKITLRHLLTHSSGLSRDGVLPKLRDGGHVPTTGELVATLDGQRLLFAPGAGYEYSNQGAAFLGVVIARASGEPFEQHVERSLLTPLAMNDSAFAPRPAWGTRLATGYSVHDGEWKREELTPAGATAATGHLYASAPDLAKYVAFELSAWPPSDAPSTGPVRRSTLRESQLVFGMQPPKPDAEGAYWVLESEPGVGLVVSHGGTIDGFHAEVRFAPELGVGVVAMTNVRLPDGFDLTVRQALDLVAGIPSAPADAGAESERQSSVAWPVGSSAGLLR
jgi:CubicO group peptidase (beta-lactamase class C family)